ncbi:cysteine rich repeat-containing protein [Rhodopseudomonas sp.]|uniref:cysteine rich repeat-containing protein n=1 Tax=Rhodopseudomonas sp. TaxID=1078 RepID=UPI0025D2914E|nr:cysteine rich repeat-containing protein [Rhodopseudomonas sp.]
MAGMRFGLAMVTALLLSGSVAVAEQAGKPCAGDIKKLCAGIAPGDGRIKACIKSHLSELSPACEDRVLTVAVAGKVCAADVASLCAGVVRGTGGVRSCVKAHLAEVKDPCKDAMSRAASGRKLLGRGDL